MILVLMRCINRIAIKAHLLCCPLRPRSSCTKAYIPVAGLRTPRIWTFLAILLFGGVVGCGSGEQGPGVAVSVHNAFRPAALAASTPLPEILRVDHFRVTVSGEGFEDIVQEFPADSSGGNIPGIPVGDGRQVLVEAFNRSGMVIRRRLISDVTIHGDQITPVSASLQSVPVVTNIQNNSLVRQNRINFAGFGEPASGIEVQEITQTDHPEILTDETSAARSVGVNINDGNFAFRPGRLSLGRHTFRIRDTQTGEESIMTIQVIPSTRIPGTGFSAFGNVSPTSFETASSGTSVKPEVLETMSR